MLWINSEHSQLSIYFVASNLFMVIEIDLYGIQIDHDYRNRFLLLMVIESDLDLNFYTNRL